jgi:pyridoxal phosphate enzyme (YggS family)
VPVDPQQIASIRDRIAAACADAGRSADEIRVIAVTKAQEPDVLAPLASLGLLAFGENRTDHLEIMAAARPDGSRFHAIGRVQSRQYPVIVAHCTTLHSLAEITHVPKLARACRQAGKRLEVFCQVNPGIDDAKAGVSPDDLPALLDAVRAADDCLDLLGLMTMAPDRRLPSTTEDRVRRCFDTARSLADQHGLARCSMGMSSDFETAIRAGATDLRLGTILFTAA